MCFVVNFPFYFSQNESNGKPIKSQAVQAGESRTNVDAVTQISPANSSHATKEKYPDSKLKKSTNVHGLSEGSPDDRSESIEIINNVPPRIERTNDKKRFYRNKRIQVETRMCLDSQKKNPSEDNDDIDVEKLSRIRFELQNPKNQEINSENVIGPQLIHDPKDPLRHVKKDKLNHNCIHKESKDTGTDDIDYHLHERSFGATTPSTHERKRRKTKMMMHRCKNCEMFTKFSRAFQYDGNKVVEYGTTTNETCTLDCIQLHLNYCTCDLFENKDETNLLPSEDLIKPSKRKCHCLLVNDRMKKILFDTGEGTENQSIEPLEKFAQTVKVSRVYNTFKGESYYLLL